MTRRLCLVLAFAALPALAAPAAATAGTASTRTIRFVDRLNQSGKQTVVGLRYQAGRQERNRLRVEIDAQGATLTDRARIRAGRGCRRVRGSGRRKVRCNFRGLDGLGPAGDRDEVRVRARLGARNDSAVISGDFPGSPAEGVVAYATLEGGPGSDVLRAGGADFGAFVGGSGNDRMTGGAGEDSFSEGRRRSGADTISGGANPLFNADRSISDGDRVGYGRRRRGVVADLAGDRDDGARGERDRIGADVESLLGSSRGSDRLTGNAARNHIDGLGGRRNVIEGGAGIDTLRGGGVVRSRDGGFDKVGCSPGARALADGYDFVFSCAPERDEPVGLILDALPPEVPYDIRDGDSLSGRPTAPFFTVLCQADVAVARCAGRARLLGADGRTLGEASFDVERQGGGDFDFLGVPVSEQDRERIRAAGGEPATLLLDMPGVPQRRYGLTLIVPEPRPLVGGTRR